MLNPEEMRELTMWNTTTLPGPSNAAQSEAASTGQGRAIFTLLDDPSRATLLNKLREQEREQEDEDNLVEFIR